MKTRNGKHLPEPGDPIALTRSTEYGRVESVIRELGPENGIPDRMLPAFKVMKSAPGAETAIIYWVNEIGWLKLGSQTNAVEQGNV